MFKKFLRIFIDIILGILCIIALYLSATNLYQQVWNKENQVGFFGIGSALVSSDSMGDTLKSGDLIIYKAQEEYSVNDVIVYKAKAENDEYVSVVHRIVNIDGENITAKGDGNEAVDMVFTKNMIYGKVIYYVPNAGTVIDIISTDYFTYGAIAFVVLIFILQIMLEIRRKKLVLKGLSSDKKTRKAIKDFYEI